MVSGAVLKVDSVPKGTTVDNIREFFNKFGEVKWVDLNQDENGETQVS
jgi:RNA recognition motif-containing protein